MPHRMELRSRAAQIADLIEEEIRSGAWTERLPGNRPLADRYGVNVKTCAVALDLLEQRGWLAPAEVGKKRLIRSGGSESQFPLVKSDKRLLIIYPDAGTYVVSGNTLLHRASYTWSLFHGEVVWEAVSFSRIKKPGKVLDALIARHDPTAILLMMPAAKWTRETEKRLPFYQMGGPRDADVPVSSSAFETKEEIAKIAGYLRGLGHRRILIPQQSAGAAGIAWVMEGLKRGAKEEPEYGKWEDYCPDFSEDVPDIWMGYWERSFKRLRPTAVVLFDDIHVLSFYSFCYIKGIRIPDDVSVICLDDQKLFNWLKPRPSYMRYPEKAATRHFQKWIEGGLKPIGMKFLPLKMIEGETVAPARER